MRSHRTHSAPNISRYFPRAEQRVTGQTPKSSWFNRGGDLTPPSHSVFLNPVGSVPFDSPLYHLSTLSASKSLSSVFTSHRENKTSLPSLLSSPVTPPYLLSGSSVFLQISTLLDRGFADGSTAAFRQISIAFHLSGKSTERITRIQASVSSVDTQWRTTIQTNQSPQNQTSPHTMMRLNQLGTMHDSLSGSLQCDDSARAVRHTQSSIPWAESHLSTASGHSTAPGHSKWTIDTSVTQHHVSCSMTLASTSTWTDSTWTDSTSNSERPRIGDNDRALTTVVSAPQLDDGVKQSMLAPYLYPKLDSFSIDFSEAPTPLLSKTNSQYFTNTKMETAVVDGWRDDSMMVAHFHSRAIDSAPVNRESVNNAPVSGTPVNAIPLGPRLNPSSAATMVNDQVKQLRYSQEKPSNENQPNNRSRDKASVSLDAAERNHNANGQSATMIIVGNQAVQNDWLPASLTRFRIQAGFSGSARHSLLSLTGPVSLIEHRRSDHMRFADTAQRNLLFPVTASGGSLTVTAEASVNSRLTKFFGWNDPLVASSSHLTLWIGSMTPQALESLTSAHHQGNFVVSTLFDEKSISGESSTQFTTSCMPSSANHELNTKPARTASRTTERFQDASSTRQKPRRAKRHQVHPLTTKPIQTNNRPPFRPIQTQSGRRLIDRPVKHPPIRPLLPTQESQMIHHEPSSVSVLKKAS